MPPTFGSAATAKYQLLTTFTKDGRPKPTAIWGVPDGDRLRVITDRARRARDHPALELTGSYQAHRNRWPSRLVAFAW
ncbi:Putative F420-dependent enzyme (fragment) [uncultured Mycobacterium sp.]|uniref:Putative F420-dependent enzyme n=1 Tax=uncultured Mycobacterium sp. TaxID=171292 RepID=A0A1Y5NUZ2_9MYCO